MVYRHMVYMYGIVLLLFFFVIIIIFYHYFLQIRFCFVSFCFPKLFVVTAVNYEKNKQGFWRAFGHMISTGFIVLDPVQFM